MTPQQRVARGHDANLPAHFDVRQPVASTTTSSSHIFRAHRRSTLLDLLFNTRKKHRNDRRILQMLDTFDLGDVRDREVKNLSLGEKRRLEIAMAVLAEPEVLLLDEPLAGLSESEIKGVLDVLRQRAGTPDDPHRRAQDFAREGFRRAAHRHARRARSSPKADTRNACVTRKCAEATGRSTPTRKASPCRLIATSTSTARSDGQGPRRVLR